MEADMRKDLFSHIQKLSFNYFDRTKTGHIMSRISNDLTMLAETAHHAPEDLLISTLTLTGAFIVMFSINPLLAAITLIPLPFIIVWVRSSRPGCAVASGASGRKSRRSNRSVENSIQGVREVKSFTNEGMEIVKFKKVNTSFLSAKEAVYSTLASFHAGEKFLMQSYSLLFIGAGALLAYYEKADFPQIIAFFMYSRYITMPMMRALSFTEQFQQASSAFERFQEVMLENPDLKDAPDAVSPDRIRGTIRFRDVSFSYPSRPDADVINHVSFEVKAGTTIALVGESGAGKSTIAALIPRFYDVSEGSIEIDGIDVRNTGSGISGHKSALCSSRPFSLTRPSGRTFSSDAPAPPKPMCSKPPARPMCWTSFPRSRTDSTRRPGNGESNFPEASVSASPSPVCS